MLDEAFADESPWMRTFVLTWGILLIVLFFFPMIAMRGDVIVPVTLLGQPIVGGFVKVMLVLLPILGITLIVLRTVNARQLTVGIVLLAGSLFALGLLPLGEAGDVPFFEPWRIILRWFFTVGTAWALLCVGVRPEHSLGRTLSAVFGPMLTLSYLFPVTLGSSSTVELAASIEALDKVPTWAVILIVLNLIPFILGLVAVAFVGRDFATRNRVGAQYLAISLALIPAVTFLIALLIAAGELKEGGLVFTAIWTAIFMAYFYLFPAFGGVLIWLGSSRRS